MIVLRSRDEIEKIRDAGRILARALAVVAQHTQPGIMTRELDTIARDEIRRLGGVAAFKNYKGYPAHICTSINEAVVHGIPSKRKLQDGDIVSIDVGVKLAGYYADAAITALVGTVTERVAKLVEVTRESLTLGIENARYGERLSAVSCAVQRHVESNGFSVVRAFVGHGIGSELHEEPEVPNYGKPDTGPRLEEGMVFAIEPMVNMGGYEVEVLEDGWTAVTVDRLPSAHFEHTIAVTKNGPEILTKI